MSSTDIFRAAEEGKLDDVKSFIDEKGVSVNVRDAYGQTPLHSAVGAESIEIVEFLVSKNADVNAEETDKKTPLHYAATYNDNIEVAKLLVSKGANVNAQNKFGYTPLHNAVSGKNVELVKFLVSEGKADVNAKDKDHGSIPLHIAVREGQSAEIVKFLVSEGKSNVNARENDGTTPLHSAVMKNKVDFAKILISAGADVNAKNNKGLTPLGFALYTENIELINTLINAGANVNAKDQPNGGTPLHYAVVKKNIEIAKILVSKGANVNAKDDEGFTPIDFAKDNRDTAMEQYLSGGSSADTSHNYEKYGTSTTEDTFSSTETKKPLIIMIVGAIIGGIIGGIISIKSINRTADFLTLVVICAFFGMGLGAFLKAFKKYFGWFISIKEYVFNAIDNPTSKDVGCIFGVIGSLIGEILKSMVRNFGRDAVLGLVFICGIVVFFWALYIALLLTLITSPFIAIADSMAVTKHKFLIPLVICLLFTFVIVVIKNNRTVIDNINTEGKIVPFFTEEVKSNTKETKSASQTISTDTFTDDRDGKNYKTVKIGTQTWLAENLNYNAKGSKCYDDVPENCNIYGRHYSWNAAMKACPKGWHLPTNAEWDKLYRYADGTSDTDSPYESQNAGKHLKAKSGWNDFNGKSGNGLDTYGFAAMPGGSHVGKFHLAGDNGYWWSASEGEDGNAYYRFMLSESGRAGWNNKTKSLLLNVRCVH